MAHETTNFLGFREIGLMEAYFTSISLIYVEFAKVRSANDLTSGSN